MQCSRCGSLVADTVAVCPRCGNPLGPAVDSYGATSFAPVIPGPQNVAVKKPAEDVALASTMMAASSPVPPTMMSGSGGAPQQPHYVVTPAAPPTPQQQPAYLATMQSPPSPSPSPSNPMAIAPYAPPPPPTYGYGAPPPYGMPMQPMPMQQGTPGLAVASLICGLLGLVPFWIGFILCLLAIVFGGIVLAQTRPGQQGRGLAITGLVFGLIFVLPAACGL